MIKIILKASGVLALIIGLGFGFGFSKQSSEFLIVMCIDPPPAPGEEVTKALISIPPEVFCTYLTALRKPDPNAPDSQPLSRSERHQTLFGFTLAGHRPNNPRSAALIDDFIARGINWDEPADGALSPLHLAVLIRSLELTKKFLAAGANPRTKIKDPVHPMDQLDAFDVARLLHFNSKDEMDHDEVEEWIELEKMLCDDPQVNAHAANKLTPVTLDAATHQLKIADYFGDDNPYPADNYDMLAKVVQGSLGDQDQASMGFASVWAFERVEVPCAEPSDSPGKACARAPYQAVSPSKLEVLTSIPNRPIGVDGPPPEIKLTKLPSLRDRPGREARLVRLRSVAVEPLGSENAVRVIAEFVQGCHGESYNEDILLTLRGNQPQRVVVKAAD